MHKLILVDTNIILDAPEIFESIGKKGDYPLITDVVLGELDRKKSSPDETIAYNVRSVFRGLSEKEHLKINIMPTGDLVLSGDHLQKIEYKNISLFILRREKYADEFSSDTKTREVAITYKATLFTQDKGMAVIAKISGIDTHLFKNSDDALNYKSSNPSAEQQQKVYGAKNSSKSDARPTMADLQASANEEAGKFGHPVQANDISVLELAAKAVAVTATVAFTIYSFLNRRP